MNAQRTARRIAALTASVALFVAAPAGIAVANDNGPGSGHGSSSSNNGQGRLTDTQLAAVQAARQVFFASVQTIKTTFRTAVESARIAIKAELAPLDTARDAARTAYLNALKANADAATLADLKAKYVAAAAAYRAAFQSARTKYATQFDTAMSTARAALAVAATAYVNSVKAAFAPGTAPKGLLTVPSYARGWLASTGNHYGWLIGHLHDSDDD